MPELAKIGTAIYPSRPRRRVIGGDAGGGAVAQLGERRNRTAEVRGSNPLGSTSLRSLREPSIFGTAARLATETMLDFWALAASGMPDVAAASS